MDNQVSDLWLSLSRTIFAQIDDGFISSFRQPGGANSRLATWDPFDRTMRYFKLMLYSEAVRQPERFFDLYRKLGRVDIGQPVSVTVRSRHVNIDYLLAVKEFLFIDSALDFSTIKSVVEIGAGFGRTCHALLALAGGGIDRYTIIDLPALLTLSRRVLAEVVPDHIHKVHFVDANDTATWQNVAADLAINIDSFQEMPPATIDAYMRELVLHCRYFYVKNPVAKYDPRSIGLMAEGSTHFQDVFSLGYCREIIDIFDDAALESARKTYLRAYCPSPSWRLEADHPMEMFAYLHHALYSAS